MTHYFELLLDPQQTSDGEPLYWTLDHHSTFVGRLGPSLGEIGPVPELNVDLVRIAVAVYGADRTALRREGGSDWNQREISLRVPVSDARHWRGNALELQELLNFLSGDRWALNFVEATARPDETIATLPDRVKRVVLMSGGADSAVGALKSSSELDEGDSHMLVSHFSANHLASVQDNVAEQLRSMYPAIRQQRAVVHLARKLRREDGTKFPSETSTRTRSFLFLALGLAVAAVHDVDLWIPENGFASINPPLGPGRRGSLSTRTTHPKFIDDLNRFIENSAVGGHIVNPFASVTKGEMFEWASAEIGAPIASIFLSATNSCSTTGMRSFGVPVRVACGVCFGCVLRRAAFYASPLADATEYANELSNLELQNWLARTSVVDAVRSLAQRGVKPRDIIALSLPLDYPLESAIALVDRGLVELGNYVG